ncbi:toll/interleukin-1 receptor domain-containing protein [Spirosoma lituiforme]
MLNILNNLRSKLFTSLSDNKTKTLWITYSWDDNKLQEVEYIAQLIESRGVSVKLDRWNINAGKRLWDQIDKFITDPKESDAWAIYATQISLESEPCREEIAYALGRALGSRTVNYPLIGIFPHSVEDKLIPASIKTRLYVSIEDNDWLERVISTINGAPLNIPRQSINPFTVELLSNPNYIRIAPRTTIWNDFIIGIPLNEKESIKMYIAPGSKHVPSPQSLQYMGSHRTYLSEDGLWELQHINTSANSNTAYYAHFQTMPTKIVFSDGVAVYGLDMVEFRNTGKLVKYVE